MSRGAKVLLAVLVLLCAGSAAWLLLRPSQPGLTARITLDGEVIEEIDLSRVKEPFEFDVEGPGGFSNTIRVEKGRICVIRAGCRDQICVHQGYIQDSSVPIVCLPNRLIIEITDGGKELDAAA